MTPLGEQIKCSNCIHCLKTPPIKCGLTLPFWMEKFIPKPRPEISENEAHHCQHYRYAYTWSGYYEGEAE